MTWYYDNGSGKLYKDKKLVYTVLDVLKFLYDNYRGRKPVHTGYSGRSEGRNNPGLQCVQNTGPIPTGKYRIGAPRASGKTGPHVMDLTPVGHTACGRSAFQIHGDNKARDASSGCIILPRSIREMISQSGDNELVVTGPIWLRP